VGGAGAVVAEGAKAGRPPIWPRRQLIDGIRFRVRTGVPWRDVPAEYGPWGRVYDLFRYEAQPVGRHRLPSVGPAWLRWYPIYPGVLFVLTGASRVRLRNRISEPHGMWLSGR
jgi:hypothetical protein